MTNFEVTLKSLRGKFIILDCNIFLLYVIGGLDKSHIPKFKRTQIFVEKDFDILSTLLKNSKLIITVNVMTEASNLLESYSVNGYKIGLSALQSASEKLEEVYTNSKDLFQKESFIKFGLSDTAIFKYCIEGVIPITIDLSLFGFLQSKGYPAINFNHVRSDYLL